MWKMEQFATFWSKKEPPSEKTGRPVDLRQAICHFESALTNEITKDVHEMIEHE